MQLEEFKKKLEHFCAYQERCHAEVVQKLYALGAIPQMVDLIMVHLIDNNFLNESRFACSFARGKHRIKSWGKIRIVNELKARQISKFNIDLALKEISIEEYYATFEKITAHHWETMTEKNAMKKRKKFCDFLLRKGFESAMVYEKLKELEKGE